MMQHVKRLSIIFLIGMMILTGDACKSVAREVCVPQVRLYYILTGQVLVSDDCQKSCTIMVQHGVVYKEMKLPLWSVIKYV